MESSIKLGRIWGIQIGAHISWLIIVVLVTLSLASYFSMVQVGWPLSLRWGAALISATLFFASVVAHELAHSLMARRYGIPVNSITLFIFGGVSQIESEAKRPSEEFWIAVVGPLTSLAVAGLAYLVMLLVGLNGFLGTITGWLASVNVALAIFNLLPGFPLDGGRVLRGLLWWQTGDVRRATRIAARVGQGIAIIMILAGILTFFSPAGGFGGLWLAFIGWFLLDAARASVQQIEFKYQLQGVVAADLMTRDCPRVSRQLSLEQFVEEQLLRTGQRCFLVVEQDHVLGIITTRDLHGIDRSRWSQLTVANVMRPFDRVYWVAPNASAEQILEIMGREEINQLPVVSEGRLLGIVSREHIVRLLTMRMEFAPHRVEAGVKRITARGQAEAQHRSTTDRAA
ncbi:MAG: site-2 protease family protein [Acidobacteriota bacterium]